jgi:hypothetical protein
LSGDYREIERRLPGNEAFNVQDFFYQYGYQIPHTLVEATFDTLLQTFCGPAGTTFLSNGFNFHRIKYPLLRPRLMIAARFSIQPSMRRADDPARMSDRLPALCIADRIGSSPLTRYVTRHLIDWH